MKKSVRLGFAALCLLAGSDWILREWQPEVLSGPWAIALRSGVLTMVFGLVSRATKSLRRPRVSGSVWVSIFGWSVLMVGLPAVAVVSAAERISQGTEALLFSLVPVFVVFFLSQRAVSFGVEESPLRLLTPALVGVAGAALLIPTRIPEARTGWAWLILLLAAAIGSGLGATRLHRRVAGVATLSTATVFSAAILLVSALVGISERGQLSSWSVSAMRIEVLRGVLFEGPVTLLTVWLLRELPPAAFASRSMLILAVTGIEGYLLFAFQSTWTTALGLLLLLVSGAWLLLADSPTKA